MQVQHLTTISHNRVFRNTEDILTTTQKHFEFLGIKEGTIVKPIPQTPLLCRVTAGDGVAAFDLMLGTDIILFVNFCCFREEHLEYCMKSVDELASKMPVKSETLTPEIGQFIYTVPVMPFASKEILQMCGEIELYIYYELYKAQLK